MMYKIIFATFLLLILASPAHAGTIQGEVKYSGEVPAPVTHKTGKFKKVCGAEIQEESLILENQKVKIKKNRTACVPYQAARLTIGIYILYVP